MQFNLRFVDRTEDKIGERERSDREVALHAQNTITKTQAHDSRPTAASTPVSLPCPLLIVARTGRLRGKQTN